MYDFEALVAELLQSRPEVSREDLMRKLAEKKEKVGAGYLTDQGALFLVAGDMGVSLRKEGPPPPMTVKDLYIGANDVSVVARILAVYPEATYNKKDGGQGKYKRLVLFDGNLSTRLTVWEEGIPDLDKLGLTVDTPVKVVSGYVKQGLDGKPSLNLGKRGKIELVTEESTSEKLPRLSAAAEKLPRTLSPDKQYVGLEAAVATEPRYSEFVRQDGSPGSLFQFGIRGDGGPGETRVVIWGPATRPELKVGQRVLVSNLRSRRGSNGELELHGDSGSAIFPAKLQETSLRVASMGGTGSPRTVLAVDKEKRVHVVESAGDVEGLVTGAAVVAAPDSQVAGRMICKSPGSLKIVKSTDFPGLDSLCWKLNEMKDEKLHGMVEVIALSHGSVEEVRLKDGTAVKKGELVVGDDTAETRLVAWRELAAKVSGIQPGERLRVVGVTSKQARVGTWELQVSATTAIDRIGGRT